MSPFPRAVAEEAQEIGIFECLGEPVPLDLEFTNPEGKTARLGDLVGRPTHPTIIYDRRAVPSTQRL